MPHLANDWGSKDFRFPCLRREQQSKPSTADLLVLAWRRNRSLSETANRWERHCLQISQFVPYYAAYKSGDASKVAQSVCRRARL